MLEKTYLFVVLFIIAYIAYNSLINKIEYHTKEIITPSYKKNSNIESFIADEVGGHAPNIIDNNAQQYVNDNYIEPQKNNAPTLDAGSNTSGIESGHCYSPKSNVNGSTFNLDTSYIKQMSEVENASDFLNVITAMRQKYKNQLQKTMDILYDKQNDIDDSLLNVQSDFNKYGIETLSKQYYDTIYKYGDFASVKKDIILPDTITNNAANNTSNTTTTSN